MKNKRMLNEDEKKHLDDMFEDDTTSTLVKLSRIKEELLIMTENDYCVCSYINKWNQMHYEAAERGLETREVGLRPYCRRPNCDMAQVDESYICTRSSD